MAFNILGFFTALGLLDDDTVLPDYGKMSADSDYELSDQQSQGECDSNLISDSEGDSSHEEQPVRTKACLSVADVFTCTEDSDSD